jgi:hypothetical protein
LTLTSSRETFVVTSHGELADDEFGISVALSADGRIVAVTSERNGGNGPLSGQVRMFVYNGVADRWNKLGDDLDGKVSNDRSGSSVALSSDGSIVDTGAKSSSGNGSGSGHVRVLAAPH